LTTNQPTNYSLDNDSRIYVFQDGAWDIKGRYSQALQDEDPVEWYLSPDDGRFSLSLLAEGIGSKESMSAATSALGSTMAGSSKQTHSAAADSGNDELSHTQNLIVNVLGLNRGLAHEKGDICMAYAKYMTIKDAVKQLNQMKKAGTWTAKLPTLQEISGIFVSKSAFFSNHHKVFPMVPLYPAMQKWLLNQDDAPEDVKVWRDAKHTFGNLENILKSHGASFGSGKKGGNKKEASSESEVEIVKGKGKGKGKAKEKGRKGRNNSDSE